MAATEGGGERPRDVRRGVAVDERERGNVARGDVVRAGCGDAGEGECVAARGGECERRGEGEREVVSDEGHRFAFTTGHAQGRHCASSAHQRIVWPMT